MIEQALRSNRILHNAWQDRQYMRVLIASKPWQNDLLLLSRGIVVRYSFLAVRKRHAKYSNDRS